MDEDGNPELCLKGPWETFIFKYIPESGQYVLWWQGVANVVFPGSRKVSCITLDDWYHFTQLSKSGDEEYIIDFGEFSMDDGPGHIYLVSLPLYQNGFRKDDIAEEMKQDGYVEDYAGK